MIKFRAWDKNTKEYFHVSELWNSGTDPDSFEFEGWTDNFGSKGRLKDIVIEQFTGLKDVNGNEIYEGDIVQPVSSHVRLKRGKPFEVNKGNYIYGKWIANDVSSKGFGVDGYYFSNEIQTVGNVHENPELLEEDK
ncbi:YopX family protein [Lactiplantibacillus plantarum]